MTKHQYPCPNTRCPNQWHYSPQCPNLRSLPPASGPTQVPVAPPPMSVDDRFDRASREISRQPSSAFSDEEMRTIKSYQDVSYEAINQTLRDKGSGFLMGHDRDTAYGLQQIISDSTPLDEDVVVYRGLYTGDGSVDIPERGEFLDKGFQSTTTSQDYLNQMLNEGVSMYDQDHPADTVVEVLLPKGSRVLAVPTDGNSYAEEEEVIIPAKSTLNIVGSHTSSYGVRTVRAVLVPR